MNLTNKELLNMQVSSLQNLLPEEILFRGQNVVLTKSEKMACGRAIWYIVQRGWGLGSAVSQASGSFDCSPTKIKRSVTHVFPEDYFIELEKQKKYIMYDRLKGR